MSKQKLFDELIEKKLIPGDSKIGSFKMAELQAILKPKKNETMKEETLFEKAIRIKAVPVQAKESDYSEAILKAIVENHEKSLKELDVQEKAKARYAKENKKK